MANNAKFKPGASGNPKTQFKSGNSYRWLPGVSGNPAGVSKLRADFERAFTEALISVGSAEEAAQLLWKAARNGEAWAIQNLCQRFAPETRHLRIVPEQDHDSIDYSKLSYEQLEQLDALLQQAAATPAASPGGESAAPTV